MSRLWRPGDAVPLRVVELLVPGSLLVCMRVAMYRHPRFPAEIRECGTCFQPIWVSATTLATPGAETLILACQPCAASRMASDRPDEIAVLRRSLEEVRAHLRRSTDA